MRYERYMEHLSESISNASDIYLKACRLVNELKYIEPKYITKGKKLILRDYRDLLANAIDCYMTQIIKNIDGIKCDAEYKHDIRNMELPF